MYYSFPVSFADNIARSLSIVFNVLFTFLILGKQTSLNTIATLAIVMVGFYMGIDGELNFSLVGTAAGVLASVFVSLNSVYTSRVLPRVGNDKSLLLFYNNFNSCLLFLPLIYQFELPVLWQHSDKFFSVIFWMAIIATGIMGFAIGLVTVLQVKVTSPLTHNISGTAKAGVQSLLAFYIWGNKATAKGILGIFLVLVGSGADGWVHMNESIKPAPTPISAAINAGTVELPKV
jgi:GDP-fucose transporter C1